ncbi:DUF1800 domain-containing protein [Mucilaginibacter ginsenosidivorax]|uniref:DUF1800 domain-containing protein n=1 Tax=Mucilaginibacter ginsenosidivorax TaxID=862126 RepID=A0A5B8W2Y2_9SPHI|nr:DUF1800 domain-containing protein [Mucilaginibacter ginsenosidivorax]QEC78093.1 DUF1800 domain-containing protein [Mucilaginibacter ginsenosidivorax]
MKSLKGLMLPLFVLIGGLLFFSSFYSRDNPNEIHKFPYKQAGLSKNQAAAHLLSRFTYGATPGQVEAVVREGLEKWFSEQLDAELPDDSLSQVLESFDALKLSNSQIVDTYPRPGIVARRAVKDGVINKDSIQSNKPEYKKMLQDYMVKSGMKPQQELFRQFIHQKILRAAYTNNQLQEVMTSFWFNHFNVSITKNECAQFIPDYERDVIRPNALGKFNDLLLATAKSPAMLYYLDNFSSASALPEKPKMTLKLVFADTTKQAMALNKLKKARQQRGLNENYAREVMELHTLGVDGGYSQQDVTQAAKVLTGWSVYPMGDYSKGNDIISKVIDKGIIADGMVHDGDFLFTPGRHDNGEKVVLGRHFGPNGGYDEGVQLLNMLAHHPSTAKFISRKLAVRFVSDAPPQSLIDKMAKTFLNSDGNIKQVLITMVSAPEFWSASALREKTKSPFELAINTVRSLNAQVTQPYQLYTWINRMGEKVYYYQAPTGFPDKGQYWINTGALLSRMNFGLAFATGRIPGITFDLLKLNKGHEPESSQAALVAYSKLIMPERPLDNTIKQLTPMLNDPQLVVKVDKASNINTPPVKDALSMVGDTMGKKARVQVMPKPDEAKSMMAQVVGIIIGSPEYQRR